MLNKFLPVCAVLTSVLLLLAACGDNTVSSSQGLSNDQSAASEDPAQISEISQNYGASLDFDTAFSNRDLDASYDEASAVKIALSDDGSSVSGAGASANGQSVSITSSGTYIVSGKISSGQISVAAGDTDKVQLVLNNAEITNTSGAAIKIEGADKVFITLADGSVNLVSDSASYIEVIGETSVDGAIFSKDDLTINGSGSLTVNGNYKHGIVSKDDVRITGGDITVNSVSTGIAGKDCVKIADGDITVVSGTDGIKSDNTEDTSRGFVYIKDGTVSITAGTDGIQAETAAMIDGGSLNITTGGGSANASTKTDSDWGFWGRGQMTGNNSDDTEESASAKGIKAGADIVITGGSINIDSSDDSVHSNGDVQISGATITAASGDDGIHADDALVIENGEINITKSYEGLEGLSVTVSGGNISVTAGDDGVNAAGGSDQSAMGGRPGQNNFADAGADSDIFIKITGGKLAVNAEGDGLDSNGNIIVTGGEVYVSGPTNGGNGALDYELSAEISGGTVIAAGSVGMAEGFSESSAQCSVLYTLSGSGAAGTEVSLTDSDGNVLVAFTPEKAYQSVVLSCPGMKQGGTYTLNAGGQSEEITLESVATTIGSGGFGGNMGGMGGPGGGNPGMPGENPGGHGGIGGK